MPEDEHGGFVTALSEAGILPPDEVIGLLTTAGDPRQGQRHQQADLRLWSERLPGVLLVETEYQLAMRVAQAAWLRGPLGELVAGTISGMDAWRHLHETGSRHPSSRNSTSSRRGGGTRTRKTRKSTPAQVLQHREPRSNLTTSSASSEKSGGHRGPS